jgi:hypothetical protein
LLPRLELFVHAMLTCSCGCSLCTVIWSNALFNNFAGRLVLGMGCLRQAMRQPKASAAASFTRLGKLWCSPIQANLGFHLMNARSALEGIPAAEFT